MVRFGYLKIWNVIFIYELRVYDQLIENFKSFRCFNKQYLEGIEKIKNEMK